MVFHHSSVKTCKCELSEKEQQNQGTVEGETGSYGRQLWVIEVHCKWRVGYFSLFLLLSLFSPPKKKKVVGGVPASGSKTKASPPSTSMPGSPQYLTEEPRPQSLHTISETALGEGQKPPTFAAYHQLRALCFITGNLTVSGCPAVGNEAKAVNFRVYSHSSAWGIKACNSY